MDLIMEEIYSHFDDNNNRSIEKHELQKLLQVPENYLAHIELYKNLNKAEFTKIFNHYDRNSSLILHFYHKTDCFQYEVYELRCRFVWLSLYLYQEMKLGSSFLDIQIYIVIFNLQSSYWK